MHAAGLGTFSKLLGAILIAQVLLAAEAAVISKREIAAGSSGATATGLTEHAHDPDTVSASVEPPSVESADGQLAVEQKLESATRKSTKLLPQLGSNSHSNYGADEFRTSGKLVLNRVAEEPLKTDEDIKEANGNGAAVLATRMTEAPSASESSVFSHNAAEVSAEPSKEPSTPATSAISGNVNNGLDELATEQKSEVNLEHNKSQSADTEEVLPELERVALRPVTANSNDAALHSVATTTTPLAASAEQIISQSNENQLEEAVGKRFEPLPKLSDNHTPVVSGVTDAETTITTTTHNTLALPELIVSTTTTPTSYRDAKPTEAVVRTPSKTNAPTTITNAQVRVNGAGGESNEIRSSASAEKRAKFISDNSTNAQQMNWPDASEVWTLAGMKTVPHVNVSGAASALQENGNELVLDSTEAALNNSAVYSNSEKNLLDWTQIMMNGAMDDKRLGNLVDQGTTQPPALAQAADDTAAVTLAALGTVESAENRTELQSNFTVKATDDTLEHVTPASASTEGVLHAANGISTHLPLQVNEIGIEMTTAAAAAANNAKSLESAHAGLMPTTTTEAADTTASNIATTPATTLSNNNHLSADNADKRSSVELLVANRTLTAATTTLPEGSKIESNIAEVTTPKFPDPDVSAVLVTSTTTAPTPTPTSPLATESASFTTEPPLPVAVSSASDVLPPVHMASSNHNNNNNNGEPVDPSNDQNSNNNHTANVDVNADVSRDADSTNNSGSDIATLERSSSETTTLSTLTASEPNTTSASVGVSNSTSRVPFSSAHNENRVAAETTTETTTTATIPTTALPAILVVNSGPNTATEVGQIGNEVELEASSERTASTAASSSTIKSTHSDADTEDGKQVDSETTTSSPVNELLITTTTTTTTAKPTTTTVKITTPIEELVETSTLIQLQVAIKKTTTTQTPAAVTTTTNVPLGSVTAANNTNKTAAPITETATETTTTAAPTAVTEDRKANEVSNSASHETETSIETNVIDQLDKSTVKTTTTTTTTSTSTPVPAPAVDTNPKDITSAESETEANALGAAEDDYDNTLTHDTTMAILTLNATTVASRVPNLIVTSTTTEPPLINLLDDSTTSTTTVSSIATKIQELYSVFSTTTSTESVAESNHTAAPTAPTMVPELTDTTSTPLVVTTMLPPAPTLHATLGATHLPGMGSGNLHPNAADANETDVNVIIAITVSVIGVVALILLVAFLYLIRKRQKQMSYGQRCRPVSLDDYSLDNVSVLGSVRRKGALRASKRSYGNIAFDDPSLRHNLLTASELVKFVERRSSIFEEFRDVPQIIARADEVPHGCEDKNRYANVIPLPETRVLLQQQHDDEKTEYINANYVRGPKDAPNYYIATQAPLEITVVDFWRMIWEQQSRVIIQATDLIENGIEKCAEYLPPSVTLDNHTTYGDFQITLKHREVKDKYAISTIVLKNTAENASRELTHYWYKWPEAGVPSEEAPIIAMLLEARSSLKSYANEPKEKSATLTLKPEGSAENNASGNGVTVVAVESSGERKDVDSGSKPEINGNVSTKMSTLRNQGPLTIHCSPGTGRTGTIIGCDMAIRSLETPKRSVDIPQIVYYVRRGRASAVQTKEQYEFIYKVAHMYATKITNLSNDN